MVFRFTLQLISWEVLYTIPLATFWTGQPRPSAVEFSILEILGPGHRVKQTCTPLAVFHRLLLLTFTKFQLLRRRLCLAARESCQRAIIIPGMPFSQDLGGRCTIPRGGMYWLSCNVVCFSYPERWHVILLCLSSTAANIKTNNSLKQRKHAW